MTTARFLPLALAVPVRELFLELAKSADVDPTDFETLTVLDFQRLVALARDAACERPTLSSMDKATVRQLAVKANVDPRTIERVARGEHVRGMPGHRAVAALREAGHLPRTSKPPAIPAAEEPADAFIEKGLV